MSKAQDYQSVMARKAEIMLSRPESTIQNLKAALSPSTMKE
jgi:hypothetical protein